MDLTGWLRRQAPPRPLLVPVPGAPAVRWAVEREMRVRGWTAALSPAEADLLVVCGRAGVALQEAVDRVWDSLPSPRARVDLRHERHAASALEQGRQRLEDREGQRSDAAGRGSSGVTNADQHHEAEPDEGSHGAAVDEVSSHGHASPDQHTDHAGHSGAGADQHGHGMPDMAGGGHDMHMMHGGVVAGLPMADRAADRDGLTLDQVHATLGPVLVDWPAGLVVRVTLQGDVVQAAEVELLDGAGVPQRPIASPPVMALDDLAGLLSVCGWDLAARTARRLRDEHLDGTDAHPAALPRFVRRVRRSRTLPWATDGLGELGEGRDATSRWLQWLEVVEGKAVPEPGPGTDALPDLLVGQELAAARVIVASFGADLHEPAPAASSVAS